MSGDHRLPPPGRPNRRRLLGLAALGAVPAALVVHHTRDEDTPPVTTATTASGTLSAAPSASAAPSTPTTGTPVLTAGGGAVPYRRGAVLLGSYLGLEGRSPAQAQALRRSQLGRDQRIVHLFYGWTDSLPHAIPYLPAKAIPMISWRGTSHRDIVGGASDALIERAARNLRRLGRPTMLRWGWEMNGDWYAWSAAKNGNDASGYVRSWRRIHDIFTAAGAKNVSWVWSVNWNSRPDESWNQYGDYYPGDRYVDWVGASGYNLHRELPDKLFSNVVAAYGGTKPIMITEVGAVDRGGRTKADWITAFAQWVEQHPQVGAVTWFDTDTHPGYDERWRIDTDARSLAAYRAMALDPHFSG